MLLKQSYDSRCMPLQLQLPPRRFRRACSIPYVYMLTMHALPLLPLHMQAAAAAQEAAEQQ